MRAYTQRAAGPRRLRVARVSSRCQCTCPLHADGVDGASRPPDLYQQHHASGGAGSLRVDWVERPWDAVRAYPESKLYVAALAFSVARQWLDVRSNAVDPGWVPTKMGGRGAPDDIELGHLTQTLACGGRGLCGGVQRPVLASPSARGTCRRGVRCGLSGRAYGQTGGALRYLALWKNAT